MRPPSRRTSLALCAAGIAVLAVAVFHPVAGHAFTNYDDGTYVTENSFVRRGLTAEALRWAWTTGHASNWHPLTWTSHMADWELYGAWAGGHHLTSLVLHVANALVLLGVLATATGAVWRSAWVAAAFAVHPLHVESVAWVAERKDVLSTLLGLLAIGAWVRYARAPSVGRYVPVVVAFALGLCAKPMLVTLPFVLLLLDLWPLGRWRGAAGVRALLLEKLPLLALAFASSVTTYLVQSAGGSVRPFERLPLAQRLGNAVVSYVAYLGQTLWPAGLAVHYPHPGGALAAWKVAGAGTVLVALTALAVRLRRTRPYAITGWLWYLGTLVPVIGLVQVGTQARADRYTYLPLVGIFLVVAWGIPDVASRVADRGAGTVPVAERRGRTPARSRVPGLVPVAMAAAVLVLAGVARIQVGHWRDSIALFEHALRVTAGGPGDPSVARLNYGVALADAGRLDEAEAAYRAALPTAANPWKVRFDLGNLARQRGRPVEAEAEYRTALAAQPAYAPAHLNLGLALLETARLPEALAAFTRADELQPGYVEAKVNRAHLLRRTGRSAEAQALYRAALALDPGSAEARLGLAMALSDAGAWREAEGLAREAVAASPGSVPARLLLALQLDRQGRRAEAEAAYGEVLRLDPNNAAVRRRLGWGGKGTDP